MYCMWKFIDAQIARVLYHVIQRKWWQGLQSCELQAAPPIGIRNRKCLIIDYD